MTGAVPATATWQPARTAREKPTTGSNGEPDETLRRSTGARLACGPMRRALLALCLAGLAVAPVALGAAEANWRIVPGRSIGGIALGWSPARVRSHIGTPSRFARMHTKVGTLLTAVWNRPSIVVVYSQRNGTTRSISVQTMAQRFRLPTGIHVGSSQRALIRAYPKAMCTAAVTSCALVRNAHAGTAFVIQNGRITSISVTRVPG